MKRLELIDIEVRNIDFDDGSREISLEMINLIIDQVILELNHPSNNNKAVHTENKEDAQDLIEVTFGKEEIRNDKLNDLH